MEVVVPMKDSPFDSTASTPYVSAPSSPNRFNYYSYHYGSAPTSPTRAAAIYAAASMVPFNWEEAPGTPKSHVGDDDDDFEFEFSGQLEKGVLLPELTAADELFEQGKIRPLKPPPRLYTPKSNDRDNMVPVSSPKSPKGGLFSPRHRNKVRNKEEEEFDPFAAAMVEATRERGRERGTIPSPSYISSSRSRKGSRSLSPMRGGGDQFRGPFFMVSPNNNSTLAASSSAATTKSNSGGGSRKWRLRDLLLFRSASEGRVTGNRSKDPLRKYTILATTNSPASDSRNSSFRSTDSSVGSSMRRGNSGGVEEEDGTALRTAGPLWLPKVQPCRAEHSTGTPQ